ncbi:hypothetical protein ACJJI4_23905 (plasmid) [Microbulbifer sp. TRSA002]|uniref:hypothetical protein n=1 Tax=Microbulbifer sp. TRSA002 TaxID=3243382 RepID=UPI00403A6561
MCKRAYLWDFRRRISRMKEALLSWVSSTLAFFRVEPALIFESYNPLPNGFAVEF